METDRLRLGCWRTEDCEAFRPIATDPRVVQYINTGAPWDDEQIREFVTRQMDHYEQHGYCMWRLIDKDSGELAGFCGLQPLALEGRPEVEIGWWLAVKYWGRGLAAEAAVCALQFGFEQARLPRIIAIAQPANRQSLRVMEKIGLTYERDAVHKGIRVVVYAKACGA